MGGKSTAFAGLAKLLYGRHWRQGLICVLAAYFDESMSHNPRDVAVVAACVSTGEQWERFSRAWTRELCKLNLDVAVFHATEWEEGARGIGPYKGLDAKERSRVERKLRWLIRHYALLTVVEGVPEEQYRTQFAPRLVKE